MWEEALWTPFKQSKEGDEDEARDLLECSPDVLLLVTDLQAPQLEPSWALKSYPWSRMCPSDLAKD